MRITCCYSTGRTEVGVLRLLDRQRRSLVVLCPWGQQPLETFRRLSGQLTDDERSEVAAAFGLDHQQQP